MEFATMYQLNDGLAIVWHGFIWMCLLSAALFSLGFILTIVGGALWQTITESWRTMRYHMR